jgi:hypothetical protein
MSGPYIRRDVVRFAEERPLDRITGQADRTSIHCQSNSVIFHRGFSLAIVQDAFFVLTLYARILVKFLGSSDFQSDSMGIRLRQNRQANNKRLVQASHNVPSIQQGERAARIRSFVLHTFEE